MSERGIKHKYIMEIFFEPFSTCIIRPADINDIIRMKDIKHRIVLLQEDDIFFINNVHYDKATDTVDFYNLHEGTIYTRNRELRDVDVRLIIRIKKDNRMENEVCFGKKKNIFLYNKVIYNLDNDILLDYINLIQKYGFDGIISDIARYYDIILPSIQNQ
jgi:hypothetical protein